MHQTIKVVIKYFEQFVAIKVRFSENLEEKTQQFKFFFFLFIILQNSV